MQQLILSTKYIQDESTTSLVVYLFVFLIVFFLTVKWIKYNKKEAEANNEYHDDFFTDFRLYGVLLIIMIGIIATIVELSKRI